MIHCCERFERSSGRVRRGDLSREEKLFEKKDVAEAPVSRCSILTDVQMRTSYTSRSQLPKAILCGRLRECRFPPHFAGASLKPSLWPGRLRTAHTLSPAFRGGLIEA